MTHATKPEVITPIVHINGTGREDLVEQRKAVYVALQNAAEALRQMAPHGRDYYPAGPEALAKAVAQHRRRQEALATLEDEMVAEVEIIQG